MDALLTKQQAADFMQIGRRTLEKWIAEALVPHHRLPSGRLRFDRAELSEWLRAGCPPAATFRRRRVAVARRSR